MPPRPAVRPIPTERLVLEPVTTAAAAAVLEGDLSGLAAGDGWPHDDTVDAMRTLIRDDPPPGWFITLDGRIVGDCGTFDWPDANGGVEIGYGLARPFRGCGYGTEAVRGMCAWLFAEAGTAVINAGTEPSNLASQRLLAKLGFTAIGREGDEVRFALGD
ncbi:MAG: GNAT family N-acetyltransferase [Acidimicrobiales bacterium]